jgi:hypothetical protein
MLGWHISIYRQEGNRTAPATSRSPKGKRLAVWQTELDGLDWIDELVKEVKAIDLGGNGYPSHYTAIAEHLIPHIIHGPPLAKKIWSFDEGDILLEKWEGRTVIDQAEITRCLPDEWLVVQVFDES